MPNTPRVQFNFENNNVQNSTPLLGVSHVVARTTKGPFNSPDKVFNTYSEGRLRLMGYVLYEKMQVYPQFRSALICLSKNEQSKFQYVKGDTEGFVNMPLQMKGICFSVFLREDTDKNMIKVSLRSVGTFPCNKVAAEFFNGGGHLNASGGEFFGTMEEAKAVFEKALEKYKPLLTAKS